MTLRHRLALAALTLTSFALVHAADLTGHWTTEFESQIGQQKYSYDFKTEGDKLTGKATYDHSMGKGENVLKEIKVTGDDVSFAEDFAGQDMTIHVTYTGKIAGDEMKLTRQVGDFATEHLVAKRAKADAAKPEAKPAPAK